MYDLCIAVCLLTTPGEVPRQLLPRHYMPRVKLRLVGDVSGGFHLTHGSHVAKSDFDRISRELDFDRTAHIDLGWKFLAAFASFLLRATC